MDYRMDRQEAARRNMRRRKRRRKKMIQRLILAAVAIVLIIIIGVLAITTGLFDNVGESSEKADLSEYFGCTSMDYATVISSSGNVTEDRIRVRDGRCYLPWETVKSQYNDRFYFDEGNNAILYTAADGTITAPLDATAYSLNGASTQTDYVIAFKEGDTLYMALDYLRLYANFSYSLYGGDTTPYRMTLQNTWGENVYAKVTKDTKLRTEPEKKAPYRAEVTEGQELRILSSEGEDWMLVMTEDLIAGYIQNKRIGEKYTVPETPVTDVQELTLPMVADYQNPVVLAWHNVTNTDVTGLLKNLIPQAQGMNTVSPTCFYLKDNDGNIESILTQEYVNAAHEAGLKIWGLVENMTYADVSSYEVLSDSNKRAYVISQLISLATQYSLDGINVDFESLPEESGEPFIQFIRELCLEAHKQNLVISVDNYVPQGYTAHYHRKEQGVFADYVIIMGYDEHYSGSKESGSVASLPFVLDGIEQTLNEVPAQKTINALPFYTRVWIETPQSDEYISAHREDPDFVPYSLEVKTLPMNDAINTVANSGAEKKWDDVSGQNYAQWESDGKTYKCWLEDGDSIAAKLNVMKAHNLGGVAVWQLAFSQDYAWEAIRNAY